VWLDCFYLFFICWFSPATTENQLAVVEGVEDLGRESLVSLAVMITKGEIRLPKGEILIFSFFFLLFRE